MKRRPQTEGAKIRFLEEGGAAMSQEDVEDVDRNRAEILETCKRAGPLRTLFEDIRLLLALVRDYLSGNYRQVPHRVLLGITFVLTYVLVPTDLVPDILPGVGWLDDAAAVAMVVCWADRDIHRYKEWRRKRLEEDEPDD